MNEQIPGKIVIIVMFFFFNSSLKIGFWTNFALKRWMNLLRTNIKVFNQVLLIDEKFFFLSTLKTKCTKLFTKNLYQGLVSYTSTNKDHTENDGKSDVYDHLQFKIANRPGVDTVYPKTEELESLNFKRMFTPHHVSHVTCNVPRVTCHIACVTCHMSHASVRFFFLQRGGASRGRVS